MFFLLIAALLSWLDNTAREPANILHSLVPALHLIAGISHRSRGFVVRVSVLPHPLAAT